MLLIHLFTKTLISFPALNKSGDIVGYNVYDNRSKSGIPILQLDAGDLDDFKTNYANYMIAAAFYGSPSSGMAKLSAGYVTGDMNLFWKGVSEENKAAWSNPYFVASFGLSIVNAGLGLYEVNLIRSGYKGTDIVGTDHTGLLPTQDYVNPDQVAHYATQLRGGAKIQAIEAYEVNGKLYISDGHHRYVASQLTGIPVPVVIRKGGGPVGYKDWSHVSYQKEH